MSYDHVYLDSFNNLLDKCVRKIQRRLQHPKKKISREEQERRKKKVENYGELEVIYISTNNNKQWVTT